MIRDRGNIKWTSMMLPEHREKLKQLLESEKDVEAPELAEDQWDEINRVIQTAIAEQGLVGIKCHRHKRFQVFTGWIRKIDPMNRTISMEGENGQIYLLAADQIVDAWQM